MRAATLVAILTGGRASCQAAISRLMNLERVRIKSVRRQDIGEILFTADISVINSYPWELP